jgi:hypothetical protein
MYNKKAAILAATFLYKPGGFKPVPGESTAIGVLLSGYVTV